MAELKIVMQFDVETLRVGEQRLILLPQMGTQDMMGDVIPAPTEVITDWNIFLIELRKKGLKYVSQFEQKTTAGRDGFSPSGEMLRTFIIVEKIFR